MKTILVLTALEALSIASIVPQHNDVKTKSVDDDFADRQKKVLSFFHLTEQVDTEAEYYKIGQDYDIEKHKSNYTDNSAFEEFLVLYRDGLLPKYSVFSIFFERMREEAISLFHLLYYAKDFDTFYQTAAFARVNINNFEFYYAFYIAVFHRSDTKGIILPAPYEMFPEFFTNTDTTSKAYRIKMQDGLINEIEDKYYGIEKLDDVYYFYSNYSNYWTYGNEEQRLSYFTEDVGLNSYYYFHHSIFPFWMETTEQYAVLKERRGELYYFFYQQLLSRYYLERLCNGLGEIPDFSWWETLKTGYSPYLSTSGHPFIQRNDHYFLDSEHNIEDIQFLDTYEKTFLQYIQKGNFKAYNQEIDLSNSTSINFVGNYWQGNADLHEKAGPRNYHRSYEHVARRVLGAAPRPLDKHTVAPTALNFYTTSARDPAFYQLYSKILKYILQSKEHLEPYGPDTLHYAGVKINDVHVDKMVTYYDFFDYDITNSVYGSQKDFKSEALSTNRVRQPRLNHKPFSVNIDVSSDVEDEAMFEIFIGPKYNSAGDPISLEDNWMNFVKLDAFNTSLTLGQNKIERKSEQFSNYKNDSIPTKEVLKLLDQVKAPVDNMSEYHEWMPKRLMLPRGTTGGFPCQLFVFVYPYTPLTKEYGPFKGYFVDNKPLGYPLDRPIHEPYFREPNMLFKDVDIYFEGEYFPYSYNNSFFVPHQNEVPKH